jgi:hypothetical protein
MSKALHIDDHDSVHLLDLLHSLALNTIDNPLPADLTDTATATNPSDSAYVGDFHIPEARETFPDWICRPTCARQLHDSTLSSTGILHFQDGELQSYGDIYRARLRLQDADTNR